MTVTHSDGTVLCQITIDSSAGVSCPSFGLTSGTASVTIYSDYYYNEWDVSITTPSGVTTTYDYSDLTGCSFSTCRYTTQSLVTLSELSDMTTPATSPAGTTLDNDDDGDTVSDSDETAAGTDPKDADTDDDTYDDGVDVFPLDASEWLDTDSDGMGDNEDAFPTDECATVDTDGDGQPDTVVSCLLYTSPSPRDGLLSRMPSSA